MRDYFQPGEEMPVAEFRSRSRQALAEAGERVRAKYGFSCSSAASQVDRDRSLGARLRARRHRSKSSASEVCTTKLSLSLPRPSSRKTHYPVIVIGGGQAGLSMSYLLKQRGIDHLVFEKSRLAESWRTRRWDTFCLVTPNWQCQLPGFPYSGPDPHGFMVKDEIVRYIESYARSFQPPLHEGVEVSRLRRAEGGAFELTTSAGVFTADQVVVATGGYQDATIPRLAERFPPDAAPDSTPPITRTPRSLPPGEVLVVGSGQSGCQIAEDLHLAGPPGPPVRRRRARARRGAIAAATWSIGSPTWATMTSRSTSIRSASGCARNRIITSPAAMAAATST